MDLKRFKKLHDGLLRGAACALWVFAFFIGLSEFFYSTDVEYGSHEYNTYITRMFFCCGIGIIGALIHGRLLHEDSQREQD